MCCEKNRNNILPLLKGYEKEEAERLIERLSLLEKQIEQLLQKINAEVEKDDKVQLACYRQAVQEMLAVPDDVKIRCVLYYLRYHKEIDITEECCRTDIEKSISSFEN